ncbi:hypothetical protein T07_5909 [Trichinella nelsoni]|uniref:Uncharacterized protein n=1 Tax=Trichinella nelsoni TaxID=6336 RepID=A0A0V0RGR4_9BILA|nr:hypothetical protein T07_5909 [Trichinella nelsoni]
MCLMSSCKGIDIWLEIDSVERAKGHFCRSIHVHKDSQTFSIIDPLLFSLTPHRPPMDSLMPHRPPSS